MKKLLVLPALLSLTFAANDIDSAVLQINNGRYTQAIYNLKKQKETKQIDYLLGLAYYNRALTQTDYRFAYKYFIKSNNKKAYYYLGMLYKYGLGIPKNIKIAIEYFQKANTKEAKYQLALMYLNGIGVLKNPIKALKLIKKSAILGYDKAQVLLGLIYLKPYKYGFTDPNIISQNYKKAAKYIYLAGSNGNPVAKKLWNEYQLYRFDINN